MKTLGINIALFFPSIFDILRLDIPCPETICSKVSTIDSLLIIYKLFSEILIDRSSIARSLPGGK